MSEIKENVNNYSFVCQPKQKDNCPEQYILSMAKIHYLSQCQQGAQKIGINLIK